MNRQTAAAWVLGAWVVAIGLIAVRQVADPAKKSALDKLPPPGSFVGSAVLFTMLWLISLGLPSLAVALAVGTDVGILVQPYLRGKPGILDQVAGWVDRVAPTPAKST